MKISNLKKDASKGFKYLAGINRPINPGQVTKLANSLTTLGCLRPVIVANLDFIDGTKSDYIIDGQHLFNALLRNNMDIPYTKITGIKTKKQLVEAIALLNSSSKSWAMLDYIEAWASINQDFVKLRQYYQTYDIELTILSAILMNKTAYSGIVGSKPLKDGTFEIVDEEENKKLLDHITDVLTIIPRMDRAKNRYVISEYISFKKSAKGYIHKTFIKNLKLQKDILQLVTQGEDKLSKIFLKLLK